MRVSVVLEGPQGELTYQVPTPLQGDIHAGQAILVPLGKRVVQGYIAEVLNDEYAPDAPPSTYTLKEIIGPDPERPTLPEPVLQLVRFAAHYYGATPAEMLRCALPAQARPGSTYYVMSPKGQTDDGTPILAPKTGVLGALWALAKAMPSGFSLAAAERKTGLSRNKTTAALRRAMQQGWLIRQAKKRPKKKEMVTYYRCPTADIDMLPALKKEQERRAHALFLHVPPADAPLGATMAKLVVVDKKAQSLVRALVTNGWLIKKRHTQQHRVASDMFANDALTHNTPGEKPASFASAGPFTPVATNEQNMAIKAMHEALTRKRYAGFLLHGVTGSGKTYVYLRLIDEALKKGRTALVLVPEIALTPQLGALFVARFGDKVATFHSGLSIAERRDEYERIASGEATVGLGARSALFLPLENLSLIIVDEEHESSFKQDETPRYNARDLAVWRAKQQDAVICLGSATPSLESWQNALSGRYQLLSMPSRVARRTMPSIELIDLKVAPKAEDSALTEQLVLALKQTLAKGEQAILFLNRRGFAPYVFCRDCGHSFRCIDCEVALTLHERRGVLLCHYCGYSVLAPDACPGCHGHRLNSFGLGTERLQAEVVRLVGDVPLVRLDRDTIRGRHDLMQALKRFRTGEARLAIGTQMVAKGHDFPGVTLVGVVSADASLNFPDFRAAERTFQLLTQVAGRAGRGHKPGRVLVQAYEHEHEAIRAAQRHDFTGFAAQELKHRQELSYPPFSFLALVRFEAAEQKRAAKVAQEHKDAWALRLGTRVAGVVLLGPAPAPLSRLRGAWRFMILVKAPSRTLLRQALSMLTPVYDARRQGVRRIIDIDPASLL